MKSGSLGTILASVLLSVGAALWIAHHHRSENAAPIRTRAIELIDEQGRVRATIGTVRVEGHEQPQVTLLAEDGRASVLLSVNSRGEGTLFFSSLEQEGKVALGYIWGSDSQPKNGQDPFGMWGVRVLGRNLQAEALGIGNDGRSVRPVQ